MVNLDNVYLIYILQEDKARQVLDEMRALFDQNQKDV